MAKVDLATKVEEARNYEGAASRQVAVCSYLFSSVGVGGLGTKKPPQKKGAIRVPSGDAAHQEIEIMQRTT